MVSTDSSELRVQTSGWLRSLPRRRGVAVAVTILARLAPLLRYARVTAGSYDVRVDLRDRVQAASCLSLLWGDAELRRYQALIRPGDVVIDIGANWGYYALAAAAVGARVYAVEPGEAFEALERIAVQVPNIVPIRAALWSQSGFGSLRRRWWQANTANYLHVTDGAVKVRMLDSLGASADIVKIDAEGAEPHILEGGSKVLSSSSLRAVLVEVSLLTYRFRRSPDDVFRLLDTFGFHPQMALETGQAAIQGQIGNILFRRA